jgi:DNA modification methylase
MSRGFNPSGKNFLGDENGVHSSTLGLRFTLPPFSVLSAREGWWQNRKRAWLSLGIKSELGRDDQLIPIPLDIQNRTGRYAAPRSKVRVSPGGSPRPAMNYKNRERGDGYERPMQTSSLKGGKTFSIITGAYSAKGELAPPSQTGTSIFDPVLCELAYRWFCPPGGTVLDPFAGGSVRGVVASKLGLRYIGMDLSERQVEANREQAAVICASAAHPPVWHVGDARDVEDVVGDEVDFILTCPPYADLEVYSDDPRDLSTLGYDDFVEEYALIIERACRRLRQDRFACIVVGDVRGPDGCYRGFPVDTVLAFVEAGTKLYNEAVLVTAVGSLPIRATRQFDAGRKLGKTHQNVLVFVKGDPRAAATACIGEVATRKGKTPRYRPSVGA